MAMIALQGVYGTPVAVAMAASAGCKQFLVPAKLSVRVRHLSPRRRASVVSAKHIGSYLDPTAADKEKEEAMKYREAMKFSRRGLACTRGLFVPGLGAAVQDSCTGLQRCGRP